MYVRKILTQVGGRVLVDVNVFGTQLITAINEVSGSDPIPTTATGLDVLTVFDTLTPEAQSVVETVAEDFIVANFSSLPTSAPALTPTRDYRGGIALMMAITLTMQCVAYAAMVIWISVVTRTIPDVTDTFVPFLAQAAVVWNYNGLLTKENRDAIAAGLGALPGGIFQTIGQILSQRRNQTPPPQ